MPLQYLESLDSVRFKHGISQNELDRSLLQAFTEVLTALVLGRDIVVPQSYAFDSLGFITIARELLSARKDVGQSGYPMRLHLFRAKTYREAVGNILRRIDESSDPFVTSLYPELAANRGTATGLATEVTTATSIAGLLGQITQPSIRSDLEFVWEEIKSASRKTDDLVVPLDSLSPGQFPELSNLQTAVGELVNPNSAVRHRLDNDAGFAGHQEYQDLVASLAQLHRISGGRGFVNRSFVHSSVDWPGATQSAAEIVGSEKHDLILECIDTLYNCVVANSIGIAPAQYSTPARTRGTLTENLGRAQDVALAFYQAPGGCTLVGSDYAPVPSFELRPDGTSSSLSGRTTRMLETLQQKASEAFREILAARGSRRFVESAQQLESALLGTDRAVVERALNRHLTLAGRYLQSAGVEKRGTGILVKLGGAGMLVGQALELWLPWAEKLSQASAVAAAGGLASAARGWDRQIGRRIDIAEAIGRTIDIRQLPVRGNA